VGQAARDIFVTSFKLIKQKIAKKVWVNQLHADALPPDTRPKRASSISLRLWKMRFVLDRNQLFNHRRHLNAEKGPRYEA